MRAWLAGFALLLSVCTLGEEQPSCAARPATQQPIILPSGEYTTGTPAQQVAQLVNALAPVLQDRRMQAAVDLHLALGSIGDALHAAPNNPRVQRLYGWLLITQVRYAEAQGAFRKALAINPQDRQARAGLAQARRLSRVIRSLPLHLRGRRRVFLLAEMPASPRPGVLVFVGDAYEYEVSSPEARYFAWRAGRYRETFRTRRVGSAGFEVQGGLEYARIWVGDFQHTGRPQALVVSGWIGADWLPTFVDIFEARRGAMRHILHVNADDSATWVHLDHDKRPEVQTDHIVGTTMSHAETGAWYDIYRYNGQRYVRANGHYRAFSRKQLDDMLDLNKRFPHDPDVLTHIAQAYRDLGQPAKARSYERQAREAEQRKEE